MTFIAIKPEEILIGIISEDGREAEDSGELIVGKLGFKFLSKVKEPV